MKKYLKLILLAGWFFAIRTRDDVPGAFVVTMFGPYTVESICKNKEDEVTGMLDAFGMQGQYQLQKCFERKEA